LANLEWCRVNPEKTGLMKPGSSFFLVNIARSGLLELTNSSTKSEQCEGPAA
jgi:hypothetical protein